MAEYKAIPALYHFGSSRIKHLDHDDFKNNCEKAGKQKRHVNFSGIQAIVMEMEFMWVSIKSERVKIDLLI